MMNFKELQRACALCSCQLTETEQNLTLQFPEVTISLPKTFNKGQAGVALFVANGWLPTFREYIDNQTGKEETV